MSWMASFGGRREALGIAKGRIRFKAFARVVGGTGLKLKEKRTVFSPTSAALGHQRERTRLTILTPAKPMTVFPKISLQLQPASLPLSPHPSLARPVSPESLMMMTRGAPPSTDPNC